MFRNGNRGLWGILDSERNQVSEQKRNFQAVKSSSLEWQSIFFLSYPFFLLGKDACTPNPCKHASTCLQAHNDRGYHCLCAPGWRGYVCERKYY